ncbi:MAG: nucleotidyltransferase domain-containing protein [Candidatus Woesearchaeota archaeon]
MEKTYQAVKTVSREKSNSLIQNALARFLLENIITKRELGNSILYKANLDNARTLAYFTILSHEQLPKLAQVSLNHIKNVLTNHPFTSIVVFGSYADSTQTKNSDLDIAIFVPTKAHKQAVTLALNDAALRSILTLDTHVFTKDEMLQMLADKQENLGKQIARKHLALENPTVFYNIINEGIAYGFKTGH